MTNDIVKWLGINKELVLEFFYEFSRFEYALKRAGFLIDKRDGAKAEPNWDVFANTILSQWGGIKDEAFTGACSFIIADPPRQQIVDGGSLEWSDTQRANGEKDPAFVLRCVRKIRNNLFHGGKFPNGPVASPERNTHLLQHAIAVLRGALTLHADVRSQFEAES
jgi:hypothetical protein